MIWKWLTFSVNKGRAIDKSVDKSGNSMTTQTIQEIHKNIPKEPTCIPKHNDSLRNEINRVNFRKEEDHSIIKRIQENQHYLKNSVDWTKLVVTLPDIFINKYDQDRFKFGDERFIRMICRTKYINFLLNKIETNKTE